MSKSFKQVLIDLVGRDLENKGFELASMKCHQGYPIYHRKSNRYIEIIQFGKDRYEPKLMECYTISAVDKSPKIWYNKSK